MANNKGNLTGQKPRQTPWMGMEGLFNAPVGEAIPLPSNVLGELPELNYAREPDGIEEQNIPGMMDFSVLLREPSQSEIDWFSRNGTVGGRADFDSGTVVLNPFSTLSVEEKKAVLRNEGARLFMRHHGMQPKFEVTEEQRKAFGNYSTKEGFNYLDHPDALNETIASRIFSGDPSVPNPTEEQRAWTGLLIDSIKRTGFGGIRR